MTVAMTLAFALLVEAPLQLSPQPLPPPPIPSALHPVFPDTVTARFQFECLAKTVVMEYVNDHGPYGSTVKITSVRNGRFRVGSRELVGLSGKFKGWLAIRGVEAKCTPDFVFFTFYGYGTKPDGNFIDLTTGFGVEKSRVLK